MSAIGRFRASGLRETCVPVGCACAIIIFASRKPPVSCSCTVSERVIKQRARCSAGDVHSSGSQRERVRLSLSGRAARYR